MILSFPYISLKRYEGNRITEYDTAHILNSGTFLENYTARDIWRLLAAARHGIIS